jgi:hypothetical protein
LHCDIHELLESRALHVLPVNGVVSFGSNSSTSKADYGSDEAAEAQRAELIGMIDLPTVGKWRAHQQVQASRFVA